MSIDVAQYVMKSLFRCGLVLVSIPLAGWTVVTLLSWAAYPLDQTKCRARHLSVEWGADGIHAVRINGHRIEATNGVVTLTFRSFDHETTESNRRYNARR